MPTALRTRGAINNITDWLTYRVVEQGTEDGASLGNIGELHPASFERVIGVGVSVEFTSLAGKYLQLT